MASQAAPLPEFENPPISEVALSIEFSPLEKWRGPHSGLYWAQIQKVYPTTEVHPPLASQIEKFDVAWQRPEIRVELASPDLSRFWFLSEDQTRLIQVQRDRFIINWRKVRGDEVYPRYQDEMRPRLQKEWREFRDFISGNKIGEIAVQQCEVTYVNDIPEGQGWTTFPESLNLYSWWGKGTDGFLPLPERLSSAGSFLMPDQQGRLHFLSQPAIRNVDQKRLSQLRLTARGKPTSDSDAELFNWMDLAREWVVRAFTDLTSSEAHKLWKRTR